MGLRKTKKGLPVYTLSSFQTAARFLCDCKEPKHRAIGLLECTSDQNHEVTLWRFVETKKSCAHQVTPLIFTMARLSETEATT